MPEQQPTVQQRLAALQQTSVFSRNDLREQGLSGRAITAAVRMGHLIRVRRGWYAQRSCASEIVTAVGIGGRITCLSLLQMVGVFVLKNSRMHVHVPPRLSRSRRRRPSSATLHWGECRHRGTTHAVSIHDAVRQSVRCQAPRAAIATLDSVLHHRVLTHAQLDAIFCDLPQRFRALLALVDASAESGPETFMRLLLRSLGVPFEVQVTLDGVGRVDFIVDGWLIIECDSREFHEGWDKQVEDRARDLAAARLGYVTIRPIAADIFTRPNEVKTAIKAVIERLGPLLGDRQRSQLRKTKP